MSFASQIILTLLIGMTLEAMWNLMNVMQVLAYIKNFSNWPANVDTVLSAIDNAVTLDPLCDAIYDYGESAYDKAKN